MEVLEKLRFKRVSFLRIKNYEAGTQRSIRDRLDYGLIFCEYGRIVFTMLAKDGAYRKTCTTDKIILVPKGSNYDLHVEEKAKIFGIDFELFAGNFSEMHELTVGEGVIEYYFSIFLRMQDYLLELKNNDLINLSFLYDIIAHINDREYSKKRYISIEKSEKYLADNIYNEKLTIKSVAKASNISEAYFRRLFKEKYGHSPYSYISDMRIKKAKNLLVSEENLSLKQISDMCGFLDIYSFSRSFKNAVGISPSQYRKKMQF